MKYYEIICDVGVIGVCPESNLVYAAQEDRVKAFGLISEKQFEAFGEEDTTWTKPISKKRYKPTMGRAVKLERIK